MKKSISIVVGLLVLVVVIFGGYRLLAGTNNSSQNKATDMTVDLTWGTLTTDQTKIWEHVVNGDDIKKLNGNHYNITVKQFANVQDLENAIKTEEVFAGVGLSQQNVDSANQDPNLTKTSTQGAQYQVVPLALRDSNFAGFLPYSGLKQGGNLTAAKFKTGGQDKQKDFINDVIKVYNNQANQDWIKKNFPNYQ